MRTVSRASPDSTHIFRLVEEELCEVEIRLKSEATSSLPLVDEINRYLHESGGKRLRPALLLLSSKLCGAPAESSLQLGVVVELIHVATLVHDDIIDNASVRRGRTSINARWGNEVTVLFGDWLYMTAFWIALKERNFRILDILIDITRKMVEGELLQLERNHRLDISLDDYLAICWHKTAHLFSGCSRLGAILATSNLEDRLARFGRSLGMAFQLTDDLLDYTSDETILGKPVLKDLEEGNVTLPIIMLLKKARAPERSFVESVVRTKAFTPENKGEIIDLVCRYGTLDDLRDLAIQYADEARESLGDLPESAYRDALLELPDLIVNREK
jgi:octaprenyl-diphosphate synthase